MCAVVGGEPGRDWVDGRVFVGLGFQYEWGNVWRVSIQPLLYFFFGFGFGGEADDFVGCRILELSSRMEPRS